MKNFTRPTFQLFVEKGRRGRGPRISQGTVQDMQVSMFFLKNIPTRNRRHRVPGAAQVTAHLAAAREAGSVPLSEVP